MFLQLIAIIYARVLFLAEFLGNLLSERLLDYLEFAIGANDEEMPDVKEKFSKLLEIYDICVDVDQNRYILFGTVSVNVLFIFMSKSLLTFVIYFVLCLI